jgi:hypothetical protein
MSTEEGAGVKAEAAADADTDATSSRRLFESFQSIDTDGNGVVGASELKAYLQHLTLWGTEPAYSDASWEENFAAICAMHCASDAARGLNAEAFASFHAKYINLHVSSALKEEGWPFYYPQVDDRPPALLQPQPPLPPAAAACSAPKPQARGGSLTRWWSLTRWAGSCCRWGHYRLPASATRFSNSRCVPASFLCLCRRE